MGKLLFLSSFLLLRFYFVFELGPENSNRPYFCAKGHENIEYFFSSKGKAFRDLKRNLIAGIGFTVLILRLAMIVLPGPGLRQDSPEFCHLRHRICLSQEMVKDGKRNHPKERSRGYIAPQTRIAGIHPACSRQGRNPSHQDFPFCGTNGKASSSGSEVLHCMEASNPLC